MQRALPWLARRFRIVALARTLERAAQLRDLGVIPILADLDQPATLRRLAGLADYLLISAPPPASGAGDPRMRRLLASLKRGAILPCKAVYISTTGVYGDCQGAHIDETRPLAAQSERALRRVHAERQLRSFGLQHGHASILRAPGIYAAERLPLARVQAGTPALLPEHDSYSNHIHADDLAHACCLALFRGKPQRAYNVCDDSDWKMGDWFDRVADAFSLPRPPRLPREQLVSQVSPALWSFMRESRRIANKRLHQELRLRLRYPTPDTLLDQLRNS
ncbi:NAD-dependent epimerase/dehydratase family protein [Chitinimonas sp.]|uniref:NAD-dependent epimerase/dehydratase family protein n=1 Tax=Chitinimonas sp. TaxID=1934313 RepID=UPI0035AF77B7